MLCRFSTFPCLRVRESGSASRDREVPKVASAERREAAAVSYKVVRARPGKGASTYDVRSEGEVGLKCFLILRMIRADGML